MPPVYPNLNFAPGYPQYNPSSSRSYMPHLHNQNCSTDPNMLYSAHGYIPSQGSLVKVAFTTIENPSGDNIYATNAYDTLTFLDGSNITISGNKYCQSITIDTSGVSTSSFVTIDCSNGTNPVATLPSDTLTLLDSSSITITGDEVNKTIKFDVCFPLLLNPS